MAGFLVVNMQIEDQEGYERYREAFRPIFAEFEGSRVAYDDHYEVVDGELPPGYLIVLRFPSKAKAAAFYKSPQYQAIVGLRHQYCKTTFVAVMGEEPGSE